MLWRTRRYARKLYRAAARHVPAARNRIKYQAELDYWRGELTNLRRWFIDKEIDWWGLPPVERSREVLTSRHWAANAILTMHAVRPTYHEELQLDADAFFGERVLEIGCGPLAPVLQFDGCERHGIDPLLNAYVLSGWPLYDLDAKLLNARGERLPYPDAWFDSVISVNCLDHVDNFPAVAREMVRVVKPGGQIRFEVEYHDKPSVTEPIALDDEAVLSAFEGAEMTKVRQLTAAELFCNLSDRYDVRGVISLGNDEQYVLWSGVRRHGPIAGRKIAMDQGRERLQSSAA